MSVVVFSDHSRNGTYFQRSTDSKPTCTLHEASHVLTEGDMLLLGAFFTPCTAQISCVFCLNCSTYVFGFVDAENRFAGRTTLRFSYLPPDIAPSAHTPSAETPHAVRTKGSATQLVRADSNVTAASSTYVNCVVLVCL